MFLPLCECVHGSSCIHHWFSRGPDITFHWEVAIFVGQEEHDWTPEMVGAIEQPQRSQKLDENGTF